MTDFEVAVERLTAWLRDYGPTKNKPFVDDITIVLCVAKGAERADKKVTDLTARLAEAVDTIASLRNHLEAERGNYWAWQGDGEDHLESLSCPVVIQPQTLLQLTTRLAAAEAEQDRIRKQRDDAEAERHDALERLAAAQTRNVCPKCGLTPGAISTCF